MSREERVKKSNRWPWRAGGTGPHLTLTVTMGTFFFGLLGLMATEESETEVSWSCLVYEYMLWVVLRKCGLLFGH